MVRTAWATFTLTVLSLAGCSALSLNPGASRDSVAKASEEQAIGECQVMFRSGAGKSESRTVSVTPGMTVEQVVQRTNALKKYSRSELELARQLPNGSWHRMSIDYDRSKKRIDPGYDYAIQPGDRLMVKEDTTTIFDDMLQAVTGTESKSLSRMLGR